MCGAIAPESEACPDCVVYAMEATGSPPDALDPFEPAVESGDPPDENVMASRVIFFTTFTEEHVAAWKRIRGESGGSPRGPELDAEVAEGLTPYHDAPGGAQDAPEARGGTSGVSTLDEAVDEALARATEGFEDAPKG